MLDSVFGFKVALGLPAQAVAYVAEQVKVDPAGFGSYGWSGRSIKYHREQIREAFGFREFSRGDEDKLASWLAEEVCPVELRDEQLCEALLVRCRAERIEPPGRAGRIVGSARSSFEKRFSESTTARLGANCVARLEALADSGDGRMLLAELKADPGQVGLETLLREIGKLAAVRAIELPANLFADASEKLVEAWRARAARAYPSDLREVSASVRLTLLAALCWMRASEITDSLVDLLIALILKVNTRADKRVERELTEDLRRVRGKESILFRLAAAAVEHPDELVRTALYPVVGEKMLRELVCEAKANERAFQARVRTVLRGSYSNHYRRMLPPLLASLGFRCNNTAYRPVMQALALLDRYAAMDSKVRFYADADLVPIEVSCRRRGARLSWMIAAASSAFPTNCACWSPCETRCGAAKSTSKAPAGGATPRPTCPVTSRPAARCNTPPCGNPPTRPRSSPARNSAWAPHSTGWMGRWPTARRPG